jgi:hypothetical protein
MNKSKTEEETGNITIDMDVKATAKVKASFSAPCKHVVASVLLGIAALVVSLP